MGGSDRIKIKPSMHLTACNHDKGLRDIHAGKVYTYTGGSPIQCFGHRYLVQNFIKHEPLKQWQVLVLCLSGPDEGTQFCCTLFNFAMRYVEEQSQTTQEQAALNGTAS